MNEQLHKQRHSFSHLLAHAVQNIYPEAQFGMGPAIENGFYYDFDNLDIKEEELTKLEEEMKSLIEQDLEFQQKEITQTKAKKLFKDQPYKLELLEDLEGKVSIYKSGDFVDLCKGPHVESSGQLNPEAFSLDRIAGAYFKGSEDRKMLTRIYGLAFKSQDQLEKHLENRKKAKKRDHRRIGKKLDLFMFDEEVGQGLPLYKPKGAMLRKLLMDFAMDTYLDNGYEIVSTPHIANEQLWERSGHLEHYAEDMYGPIEVDEDKYRLKPMNCPFHIKMFNSKTRSYRELPKRWAEMGTVYRYEKSGELHGLTRPRGFTQDDAHIICTGDQLKAEIQKALEITQYIYSTLGMEDLEYKLSVRDPNKKEDYFGGNEEWKKAEKALEEALEGFGQTDYIKDEGEAAFYAPKIDIDAVDAMGRKWQLSTIQIDFNSTARFDMTYINEEGEETTPFMIHRALLGSIERFLGVYIEHTKGKFPVWLSPIQAWIIPVSEKQSEYAFDVKEKLEKQDVRVDVKGINETLSKAIREGETQQIPYLLVVGGDEKKAQTVSVRYRGDQKGEMKIEEFLEELEQTTSKS